MRVVVTGSSGFIGGALVRALLRRETLRDGRDQSPIEEVALLDPLPASLPGDDRLRAVRGSVLDPEAVACAITPDTTSVFHLASVVSAEAEADLAKGMAVNLDGTRGVLERCRTLETCPAFVFASSVAAFGGDLPSVVQDCTPVTPRSSYGVEKVMGEMLVSEYTRRGHVDGRTLRLPTVAVRPGAPNRAASGFASAMVREPLGGLEAVCPVDPDTVMWLTGPGTAVRNLIHAHELAASVWGEQRVLNLPGISVSVRDMVAALDRVAGPDVAARVAWRRDPLVERVVGTWPGRFDAVRALALGFEADAGFEALIREYRDGCGATETAQAGP